MCHMEKFENLTSGLAREVIVMQMHAMHTNLKMVVKNSDIIDLLKTQFLCA